MSDKHKKPRGNDSVIREMDRQIMRLKDVVARNQENAKRTYELQRRALADAAKREYRDARARDDDTIDSLMERSREVYREAREAAGRGYHDAKHKIAGHYENTERFRGGLDHP